jgi:hypothetical protein
MSQERRNFLESLTLYVALPVFEGSVSLQASDRCFIYEPELLLPGFIFKLL